MAVDETDVAVLDADAEEPQTQADSPKKFDVDGKKLKILALLAVVMVGEAGAMYLFVPGAEVRSGEDAAVGEGHVEPEAAINIVEGEIGQFNVTNSVADPASTIHISFTLSAIIPTAKAEEFKTAAGTLHKGRIRQAVLTVARSAGLDELNDASLSAMKRLLREEIRKVLNSSYISEVVISDFKTMRQ